MENGNRRRKVWSTATDPDLYDMFKKLAADTRIPSTRLLDEAIEDLLVKYKVMDEEEKKNP